MNKSSRLVCGIGFNNSMYPTTIGAKKLEEYTVWQSMLLRCTKPCWDRQPAYTGTTCSQNFKSYEYFYEWCQEQTGFGLTDERGRKWQLDKDILITGNKHYSEDTCVFVPQSINLLFNRGSVSRGKYPVGVTKSILKNKYISQCCNEREIRYLGCFDTEEEAFNTYKTYKEGVIKYVANDYKASIDPRAYQALMQYEVNIDD